LALCARSTPDASSLAALTFGPLPPMVTS
jgi:hypothetical protein